MRSQWIFHIMFSLKVIWAVTTWGTVLRLRRNLLYSYLHMTYHLTFLWFPCSLRNWKKQALFPSLPSWLLQWKGRNNLLQCTCSSLEETEGHWLNSSRNSLQCRCKFSAIYSSQSFSHLFFTTIIENAWTNQKERIQAVSESVSSVFVITKQMAVKDAGQDPKTRWGGWSK